MKNSYKEIKINLNKGEFYFTYCGITARDFGDRISIVDTGARNGVIAFEVSTNEELADKIRTESCCRNEILIEPGATFIAPSGEKSKTKEQFIVIPSKYDYNYKLKFDNGCICSSVLNIDSEHRCFNSMLENRMMNGENNWESYMKRFSRGGSPTGAAVFSDGQQFYIELEWSTLWQDNRPHALINGFPYVYDSYDGWKARHNEFDVLWTNDGLMEFLEMFIEEDRRRR